MGDHVLFFYGTLLAPQMLHRVIHGSPEPEQWQKDMLHFRPAVLHGYRRHRVRGEDYPAIIPVPSSSEGAPTSATATTATGRTAQDRTSRPASVLGTVVSGLTNGDIHRLDVYEGSEYDRVSVRVRVLKEALQGSALGAGVNESSGNGRDGTERYLKGVLEAVPQEFTDEAEAVDAETYVWIGGTHRLQNDEWDFEAFKRDKMRWWLAANESDW
ncbi:putative disease resistance protein Aig2 [Aspergillus pseudoustus]|uniref:Putative gamma-glutamylcyclotransferase n=1 Tax=Aspergillus pseudoustus TaxID=1810923 RepID=A0ABR4K1G7_9EURO